MIPPNNVTVFIFNFMLFHIPVIKVIINRHRADIRIIYISMMTYSVNICNQKIYRFEPRNIPGRFLISAKNFNSSNLSIIRPPYVF